MGKIFGLNKSLYYRFEAFSEIQCLKYPFA